MGLDRVAESGAATGEPFQESEGRGGVEHGATTGPAAKELADVEGVREEARDRKAAFEGQSGKARKRASRRDKTSESTGGNGDVGERLTTATAAAGEER